MGMVTNPLTADSTEIEVMAGVLKKLPEMTTGCRLILEKTFQVCGIATQGDRNGNEWVTDFKLSYSSDGNVWTFYQDANGVDVVRS